MLVEQPATFPTIADVAQPRYRLAGIRFNPSSNGPSVERYDVSLKLQALSAAAPKTIAGLPLKLKALDAIWSPDSRHVAFMAHATAPAKGLDLWVVDVAASSAHKVGTIKLNAVLGTPCSWLPDSASLPLQDRAAVARCCSESERCSHWSGCRGEPGQGEPCADVRGHAEDHDGRGYLRVLRVGGSRGRLAERRGQAAAGQGADRARDAVSGRKIRAGRDGGIGRSATRSLTRASR